MKLAEIKKACMAECKMYAINAGINGRWISDGRAAWAMPDLPLDERSMITLFEITDKERSEMRVQALDVDSEGWEILGPSEASEIHLTEKARLTNLLYLEMEPESMQDKAEVLVIELDKAKPGMVKGRSPEYWLRPEGPHGQPVVAMYDAMKCTAIIAPLSKVRVKALQESLKKISEYRMYDTGAGGAFENDDA